MPCRQPAEHASCSRWQGRRRGKAGSEFFGFADFPGTLRRWACSWGMRTRAEFYRERAAEARQKAERITDVTLRRAYEDAARTWLKLAEEVEWIEDQRHTSNKR